MTTYVPKTRTVDDRTELLAGLRMEITNPSVRRYGFHRSAELKARQVIKPWVPSKARPNGSDFWAVDLDLTDIDSNKSEVVIPVDAIEPYFHKKEDGAFLMLKVLAKLGDGYYTAPGFLSQDPTKKNVYGFDKTEPLTDKGQHAYALPQHMKDAGQSRYFFLMRLRRTSDDGLNVELTVDKVTVSRGKAHYTVLVDRYFRPKVYLLDSVVQEAGRVQQLRDLPLADFVRNYREYA